MADYSQGPIGGAPQPGPYIPPTTNAATGEGSADNGFMSTQQPAVRPWLKFLIPVIMVLNLGVLAMVAYAAHELNTGADSLGFNIFAAVWTLIVGGFFIVAFFVMPHLHFKWIIFILSILSCIWWLTAFAYLASQTHSIYQVIDLVNKYASLGSDYGYSFAKTSKFKRDLITLASAAVQKRQYTGLDGSLSYYYAIFKTYKTVAAVMAGASAIGAIIWVLFMVFTILYALALFRGSSSPAAAGAPATYEPKVEMQPYGGVAPPYTGPPAPAPVGQEGFAPTKPEAVAYDPRMQPGTEFMTPPPPPGASHAAGGMTYVNPAFGAPGSHPQAYEMAEADRNYTVSPLSIREVNNAAEMPAHQ
ncbi:hypothetical protein TWF694_004115 [Orbilia ellipsospora]|uniref:MARVEL domain-containing protein n=1 Tax=Orbilia ellipsospora TaxID=2528407 RepID=A0AAV9WYG7_9PEZI